MTARKPKSQHKPPGRPTVITEAVRSKIQEAAALDASVEEICFYAGISRDAYYDLLKREPEFSDRIADLRQRPVLKARQAAIKLMEGSYSSAMDYLTRKRKAEFSQRTEVDVTTQDEKIDANVDIAALAAKVAAELKELKT